MKRRAAFQAAMIQNLPCVEQAIATARCSGTGPTRNWKRGSHARYTRGKTEIATQSTLESLPASRSLVQSVERPCSSYNTRRCWPSDRWTTKFDRPNLQPIFLWIANELPHSGDHWTCDVRVTRHPMLWLRQKIERRIPSFEFGFWGFGKERFTEAEI